MPDCDTVRFAAACEHVERGVIAAVLGQCMIVAAECSYVILAIDILGLFSRIG